MPAVIMLLVIVVERIVAVFAIVVVITFGVIFGEAFKDAKICSQSICSS